jgi:replication-associated recombination protein RarA
MPHDDVTKHGYARDEVLSALQKSIRRSEIRDALFWALELNASGLGTQLWNRLRTIASEDIAVESMACVQVATLHENYRNVCRDGRNGQEIQFLTHAVVLLATATKSRFIDHCKIVALDHFAQVDAHTTREPAIPDYAIDKHTRRGRQWGRGSRHFHYTGALCINQSPRERKLIENAFGEDAGRLAEQEQKRKVEAPDPGLPHGPRSE